MFAVGFYDDFLTMIYLSWHLFCLNIYMTLALHQNDMATEQQSY